MLSKMLQLLSVFSRHPQEAVDRASLIIRSRLETNRSCASAYAIRAADDTLVELSRVLYDNLEMRLQEGGLAAIAASVREAQQSLPKNAPFRSAHNGDSMLARLCYLITRAVRPDAVVETGVCYGVISAFVLQALKENGRGRLHSIDLPPLGENADDFVGRFVPPELRGPWTLHRGTSATCLPPLLEEIGPIGMFVHDSLHTYANMRCEFVTAWPALNPGGVLISDDVHNNSAFQELTTRADVACAAVMKEEQKQSLFGVAVKTLASGKPNAPRQPASWPTVN
jgi:predicted O-methyltransferase YrrM